MNDSGAKQQIVEKIKSNSNIMVTVSSSPSVDELSAALGLTILLNKMNKHATAVFSGAIPPAITFLDPQKTFENTVDSLRDFIIALDKEKADHLRYKVEGDVVKIFITPYRTTIGADDLDFSQGDYNVELVLALGVKNKDYLDGALAAHGRILHDATVVTMSAGPDKSNLGTIDWHEENASSLSEMLVSLCEALKGDKGLVDEQIATAFLTGIVAATDRFSNNRTTSRVMTMAAQLMTSGANQQLIASKLEEAHAIGAEAEAGTGSKNSDGTTDLSEGESTKLDKKQTEAKEATEPEQKSADSGALSISHEKQGDVDAVAQETVAENQEEAARKAESALLERRAKEVATEQQAEAAKVAEQNLAAQLASSAPATATPLVADLKKDLAAVDAEIKEAAEKNPGGRIMPVAGVATDQWQDADQAPSMGGILNATAEQAAEDKRRADEDERNHTILSHSNTGYIGDSTPTFQSPLNATNQKEEEPPMVDPFKGATLQPLSSNNYSAPSFNTPVQPSATTLADIDKQNRIPHEEARAAVDAAFGAVPFTPAAATPSEPAANTALPEVKLPSMPPLPDFSTLPPLPTAQTGDKLEDILEPAPVVVPPPQSNDPAQFKIPGQN